MKLENRTILITGASSGLGRAMALALSHQNNRLIVTARREQLLNELADVVKANGSKCIAVPADVTDSEACQHVIETALAEFDRIEVAILNAGGGKPVSMENVGIEQVIGMMRVNYDGLVHFLIPMIAHMRAHQSTIAYTGSPAGYLALPKSGPYSAAKAAGRILFDTCRIELKDTSIKLVALYPGFTRTPGLDPNDVPIQSLIIDTDRAVREMLWAIRREKSHHMFPKRIRFLMTLARLLPEPVRRWVLRRAV